MSLKMNYAMYSGIFLIGIFITVDGKNCLENLRVVQSTSTNITLSWRYSCDGDVIHYKVYYTHSQWFACDAKSKVDTSRGGGGIGVIEINNANKITLSDLNSFSLYSISVSAMLSSESATVYDQEIHAETLPDTPNVAATEGNIIDASSTTLGFVWKYPVEEKCAEFNGNLNGSLYWLRGINSWFDKDDERSDYVLATTIVFSKLLPFSNYSLEIFSVNTEGLYNGDKYLTIYGRTSPGPPVTPTDLKETFREYASIGLRWSAYPPTGVMDHFSLRWKLHFVAESTWSDDIFVAPNVCDEAIPGTYCYTLPLHEMDPNIAKSTKSNYTFQVSSFNNGNTAKSPWSDQMISYPQVETNSAGVLTVTAILFCCCLFIVMLAALCSVYYSHRRKILRRNASSAKYFTQIPTTDSHRRFNRGTVFANSTVPDGVKSFECNNGDSNCKDGGVEDLSIPPPMPFIDASDDDAGHLYEVIEQTEDGYLVPKETRRPHIQKSTASLEESEYLKPTTTALT